MAARGFATSLACVVVLSLSMPVTVFSQNEEGYQYSNYDNKEASNQEAADDNFIITHYGTERYTPVEEAEMRIYNPAGYFKSEVIPVDPISGAEISVAGDGSSSSQKQEQQRQQQWTADGDLLVPLHTGYTLNAKPNSAAIGDGISAGFSIQVSDAVDDGSSASSVEVDDETNSSGHRRRADDDSAQQRSPSTSSWPKKSENKNKRKKYKEKTIYGFANKPIKELYYYAGDEESSVVDDARNSSSLKRRRHLNENSN